MDEAKKARSDAARNRSAILAAATSLFEHQGVASVSMQDIAQAAGVSKAAIFRHFGDRSGLIQEILEPRATRLLNAVQSDPPPLGPGAPPAEALAAYLDALLDFVWHNRPLIRAFEHLGPDVYYTNEASIFWLAELTRRLAVTAPPGTDVDYLAYAVLTSLRADVIDHLLTVPGMGRDRIRAGIRNLATSTPSASHPEGERRLQTRTSTP